MYWITSRTPTAHRARTTLLASVVVAWLWLPLQTAAAQDASNEAYTLTLGEQQFDPLAGVPKAPAALSTIDTSGPDLQLVQFTGPTQDAWLSDLRNDGLEIVQYIYPHTYVVWGDATALAQTARSGAVRWSGPFLPAYRLLPQYRALRATSVPTRVLIVAAAGIDDVVARIAALGVTPTDVRVLDGRFAVVGCDATPQQLVDLAGTRGVYSVQPVPTDGGLRGEMTDQICANNVDPNNLAYTGYMSWLSTTGLSGAGVIIANVDSGFDQSHPNLVNRVLPCTGVSCGGTYSSTHGTHTAGIMVADGSSGILDSRGFLRGLGMAPGAMLVEQLYSPFFVQTDGMKLLMRESYENGASLSGNSWGPSSTPKGYDNDTMQVDIGVRDVDPNAPGNQPFTYVLSIMNGYGGTSSQGTPDEAKNIFTVGSTKAQTTGGSQYLAINDLSSNTAHGPALDGRKIPHLVAPGSYVDSTFPSNSYGLMSGTSMASPHVSGAVALFIEYYRQRPDYTADPSPALIKAAFLPVAHDLAGHLDADGYTLGHPFDSKQGWGRLNAAAVLAPANDVLYFDAPTIFDNTGAEWTQEVVAHDPNQPLRLMLVWTDAPGHGLGGSTPAWNNDLDLVVDENGNTYRGNNFDASGWSQAGGSADYMNNTEGVFIGPTAPARYVVHVLATDINSDGVPNSGDDTDQDFALVCYNCEAARSQTPGDMNCDGVVDFADINPFVTALVDGEPQYIAGHPACRYLNADVSGNGTVGFDDINPFVALLVPAK